MFKLKTLPKRCIRNARILNTHSVNSKVVDFEYAVRGEQAIRAEELRNELATSSHNLPFKNVVSCNIGNPQQLGQKPITFFRQVSALLEYPDLLNDKNAELVKGIFPADTIQRAKELLKSMGGSIGAYSHSQGIPLVRKRIAEAIGRRDGYPADPNSIFLTAGASPGVQTVLQTIIAHENVGIMIPIPQYPLYTASISLLGGKPAPYYLDESKDWSLTAEELTKSLKKIKKDVQGIEVRALCVINPGNPTGQTLALQAMKDIIEFCRQEKLVLMADEVYQANVYTKELPFHSFKKVLKSMGSKYDSVELISFHSISKGMIGECGRRGGYFECVNVAPEVMELFYKIASVSLCPPVQGQVMVELMMNPPKKGDPSYPVYEKEQNSIYDSLRRRAQKLAAAFNSLEGVSCNDAQGAMYLFPQVKLPSKAVAAAKANDQEPDSMYSMELLNATGVCVVPGSGFGQEDGTWHFRSTFLPPENQMDEFIQNIKVFHESFMSKYR
ncbi:Alanine--glyoxylate aminotransferase 2, mitochondrial [Terramyces sp. JEL0728]|nr:Alanine--glyoxylate aminotransferase 2, mitochondrial [Terramyces sp. JEL0728]